MANHDRMAAAEKPATIHITGDSVGIARAKDMLSKLSLQKVSQIVCFTFLDRCYCYCCLALDHLALRFPFVSFFYFCHAPTNFGNQKTTIGKFYVSQGLYPASQENRLDAITATRRTSKYYAR